VVLDHITFGVADFRRSVAFYDVDFGPLGLKRLFDAPRRTPDAPRITGYGDSRPFFWIADDHPTQGRLHVALSAPDRRVVDRFYAAALSGGGRDKGPPGPRPQYDPEYDGAFVLDPDGHNIEFMILGT